MTRNAMITTEVVIPEGFVVVDEYTPCHSVVPWDYYGLCHIRPILRVLREREIKADCLEEHRRIAHPIGSGPKGSVRFGDDMLPSVYRIIVPIEHETQSIMLINEHKGRVANWLYNNGPIPPELRD